MKVNLTLVFYEHVNQLPKNDNLIFIAKAIPNKVFFLGVIKFKRTRIEFNSILIFVYYGQKSQEAKRNQKKATA